MDKNVNVAENIISDKGNINLSMKLGKYIIGLLIFGISSILGTSYGLFTKTEANRKSDKVEIMSKLNELKKEEVKPNTTKNYSQDTKIEVLYERTKSRQAINTTNRPATVQATPPPTVVVVNAADEHAEELVD